jgi:hypothetical protein
MRNVSVITAWGFPEQSSSTVDELGLFGSLCINRGHTKNENIHSILLMKNECILTIMNNKICNIMPVIQILCLQIS